jgi:uncharacterized protein YjbI with pentapeptide repeats
VDFSQAVFNDIAIFIRTNFLGEVDFSKAKFNARTRFDESSFSENAHFRESTLSGDVSFYNTKFAGEANFIKVLFSGEISIALSKFLGEAYYSGSNFTGKVKFDGTKFYSTADFKEIIFIGETYFNRADFLKETNFNRAKFSGKVNFLGTTFSAGLFFSRTEFRRETNFNYVVFDKGEKVIFDTVDLSRVSFINTDISRVNFSDKVLWGTEIDRFKIIDEKKLEWSLGYLFRWNNIPGNNNDTKELGRFLNWRGVNLTEDMHYAKVNHETISISNEENCVLLCLNDGKVNVKMKNDSFDVPLVARKEHDTLNIYAETPYTQKITLGDIKAVYRNLRENYEYRMRYDEAGEFFIREMELKRKYREDHRSSSLNLKKNGWFRRNFSITGFYHLASYGEKLRMPAILGISVLSFSILFYLIHFHTTSQISFSPQGLIPLGNATERSITIFLQQRTEHLVWEDYIVKALGILSLGLFAIPLRRKFERKFRH